MIAISGLFTLLFLSPVIVIALMLAAALVGRTRRRGVATWLLGIGAVLLFVFSTPVMTNLLLRPLELRYPPFAADGGGVGAVVVLGSGVRNGAPDEGGDPSLSRTAYTRVVSGFLLSRRLGVPIVVSGGTTWRNQGTKTEAEVARNLLVRLGAARENIYTEGSSRTTWENARNVAVVLKDRGVSRVALVTSAAHMPRAMLAFGRAGVACVAAPTDYLSVGARISAPDFLPSFGTLQDSFSALQEYFGLVLYAVRG
jgi:uncharacterized SAM-binding protein YcdF (DUF218 family)